MRRIQLAVCLVVILVFAGCMTPQEKQWTCDTAKAAYMGYQATLSAGRQPSLNEIYAATAAGTFLWLWCGWDTPVPTNALQRARAEQRAIDPQTSAVYDWNRVQVLRPPPE